MNYMLGIKTRGKEERRTMALSCMVTKVYGEREEHLGYIMKDDNIGGC